MEDRWLFLVIALFSTTVSAQYDYGDRFAVDGFDVPYGDGRDNTVGGGSSGCPDFGPMESFNAEGLQRGKVRKKDGVVFIFGVCCVIR